MESRDVLGPYAGREQAFVKHQLLEAYLERFMMILGQRCTEVLYVDCFAGPWESAADDYADTSFGRAVRILQGCQSKLDATFSKKVTFRALFIEQDGEAFTKLDAYARRVSTDSLRVEAWNGPFQSLVADVAAWIGNAFTFVLIDPKGYAGLIDPDVLAPLISKRSVEALINYMWHFIQFGPGHAEKPSHHRNMVALFGEDFLNAPRPGDPERAEWFLKKYRQRLAEVSCPSGPFRTRTVSFPVAYPGRKDAKYFLVHATHADVGVIKFAEASEQAAVAQDSVRFLVRQQKKEERTGTADLFAGHAVELAAGERTLTQPWLDLLPIAGAEILVDEAVVAQLIERYGCFISELQRGAAALIEDGRMQNLDAKRKRSKNVVHFNKGGERLRRLV